MKLRQKMKRLLKNSSFVLQRIMATNHLGGLAFLNAGSQRRCNKPRSQHKHRYIPSFLELEARLAPAAPIAASWVDLGPQPQQNMVTEVGDAESLPTAASGRVTSLAMSTNVAPAGQPAQSALFVGTASGGVWRSTSWDRFNVSWEQVSDDLVDAANMPISVNNQPKWINDIGALAVDPQNPRTIYAGTGEANFSGDNLFGAGILKSTDGGDSWKLVSNAFAGKSVSKIFVDPRNSNTVYAAVVASLAAQGGVFRSLDGGTTWNNLLVGTVTDLDYTVIGGNLFLYAAVGEPNSFDVGPGGMPRGVHLGTEQPAAPGMPTTWMWQQILAPRANDPLGRIGLAVTKHLATPQLFVMASRQINIQMDPGKVQFVYLAQLANNGTIAQQKYVVDRTRNDFNPTHDTILGDNLWYYMVVGIDESAGTNNGQVGQPAYYIGGKGIENTNLLTLATPANARIWQSLSSDETVFPHVDYHAILFADAGRERYAFVGEDGGVFKLTPNYHRSAIGTWHNYNFNLETHQVTSVGSNQSPANPVLIEGSQDNGTARWGNRGALNAPTSTAWDTELSGDGGAVRVSTGGSTAYAVTAGQGEPRLAVSRAQREDRSDLGTVWTPIQGTPMPIVNAIRSLFGENRRFVNERTLAFYPPIAVSPSNPNRVYFGTNALWVGEGAAANYNWSLVLGQAGAGQNLGGNITAIAVALDDNRPGGNGTIIYVGLNNGEIYRFTQVVGQQGTWARVSQGIGLVTSITVDRGTVTTAAAANVAQNIVYATYALGGSEGTTAPANFAPIVMSKNGGGNWWNMGGDLPFSSTYSLVIDYRSPDGHPINPQTEVRPIYIGTNQGVFISFDVGKQDPANANRPAAPTWSRLSSTGNAQLPVVRVTDLVIDTNQRLVAATYGRGVYSVALVSVPANPQPSYMASLADNDDVYFATTEGQAYSAAVITFVDSSPDATAADYSGTITWDDGSSAALQFVSNADGSFSGIASGTFPEAGFEGFLVSVTSVRGDSFTGAGGAYIADAALTGQGINATQTLDQAPPIVTIGSFTDANSFADASDFIAWITWGDGTEADLGLIEVAPDGSFQVKGTHPYAHAGTYTLTIDVLDNGGATTQIVSQMDVSSSYTVALSGNPLTTLRGQQVTFTATVTPTDPNAPTPTGLVHFLVEGVEWGSSNLDANAQATFVTDQFWEGQYTVVAQYDPNSNGSPVYDSDSVTVNVLFVNQAPAGADNTVTTSEDTGYTFTIADFGFSDRDNSPPNAFQAVKITTLPAAGTLTLDGAAVSAGDFVSVSDIDAGKLVYTPALHDIGRPYTSFTFQVQDDGGTDNGGVDLDTNPKTMTIDVLASGSTLVQQIIHGSGTLAYPDTTTTVSLGTSVPIDQSVIIGTSSSLPDWPGNTVVRYEFVDQDGDPSTAEAVQVSRDGDGGYALSGTVMVSFSVLDFCSGLSVERVTVSFGSSDTQVDVPLSTLAPADRAFVLLSQSTLANQPNQDARWSVRGELVNGGTTLRLRRSETGVATTVSAQIVTFAEGSGGQVQTGTVVVNGSASVNYTPQAGAGELLFFSNSASGAAGVEGKYRVSGTLANGQATFATAVPNNTWVTYYIVSIPGAVVQSGVTPLAAQTSETGAPQQGVHYQNIALNTVDLSSSFAYVTASGGDSTRNEALGDTLFTAVLTDANTLHLERADRVDAPQGSGVVGSSSLESAATAAWFVVQLPMCDSGQSGSQAILENSTPATFSAALTTNSVNDTTPALMTDEPAPTFQFMPPAALPAENSLTSSDLYWLEPRRTLLLPLGSELLLESSESHTGVLGEEQPFRPDMLRHAVEQLFALEPDEFEVGQ